jgi:predicted Zn-dependent protease
MHLEGWMKRTAVVATFVASAIVLACATNPATGRRQLALISEQQEIEMGRQADPEIVASMGLYDDDDAQAYVQRIGTALAATSERPSLPWTFRVLDDPTVNAFALPGGFIYVTRGIMTHLSSEAELAAVLAHEIGHVTGRHSVEQLSQAQLFSLGLGVGMVVSERVAQFGGLAQAGLSLLFLRYSRDDESEADELGFRYLTRGAYDAREMPKVFDMLGRIGESRGSRVPNWLATHPDPERRAEESRRLVAEYPGGFDGTRVARDAYFDRIDGMIFGDNPREGFFEDALFLHPDLEFRLRFPDGWTTANQRQNVYAVGPEQDAVVELRLAEEASPQAAATAFLAQEGVRATRTFRQEVNGFDTYWARFEARSGDTDLAGTVAFLEHGGNVYRLLGYGLAASWPPLAAVAERSIGSFERLTDRAVLSIQPDRLRFVQLSSSLTLEQFVARYPSTVPPETIALINQIGPDQRLAQGQRVKRIVNP